MASIGLTKRASEQSSCNPNPDLLPSLKRGASALNGTTSKGFLLPIRSSDSLGRLSALASISAAATCTGDGRAYRWHGRG